jgi:hypothetical protein
VNGPINLFVLSCPCLPATLHIQRRQLKLLFPISSPPSTNERWRAGARSTFFFAMAISFYSIRYKLYPRIHTSILCHPVSRLWPASQSVRRGPAGRQPGRGPAGTECRLIDFIAVFELRTLPKGSFPLCIGMFDYKPKICYLPGRKNN